MTVIEEGVSEEGEKEEDDGRGCNGAEEENGAGGALEEEEEDKGENAEDGEVHDEASVENEPAAAGVDLDEFPGENEVLPVAPDDIKECSLCRLSHSNGHIDELEDEFDVDEVLRDAVEGSLRLKRLLRSDVDGSDFCETAAKRRKTDVTVRSAAEHAKVNMLLNKWGLQGDAITRHVLENLTLSELTHLATSNYAPEQNNAWKCPGELLQTHTNLVRESKTPGGGALDVVACFRHRWKLDAAADKALRSLGHKDLRYVIRTFDGSKTLDEVIVEAKASEPEEEGIGHGAVPDAPGVEAMSRYTRLELFDPVADSTVFGDANLTFSLGLARQRKALGHVGRVVATTFETLETLQERYREIDETILKLEEHFAEVHHGVDCTRIAIDTRFSGMSGSFGAVYYNFPHAGAVGGFFDGHPIVNWRHENLMRLFFRALRLFMVPGGIVKVASNAGAVGVRFSYIVSSAAENEFEHFETMPFLSWALHRYGRSYGDRRDTYKRPGEGEQYNAQRADSDMVYCFVYRPNGEALPRQTLRLPPTYKTMLGCTDGPLGERQGEAKKKFATELYKRFVTECSGVHVG